MDTTAEHPFFVYGHGWASCNPEGSIQAFGLKCQRLRVGDVCISLTPREPTSPLIATSTAASQSFYHNDDSNQIPQNLSKKPETIPTTATGTTVTSRPVPPFDCHQSLAFYATYLNTSSMNAAINAASMLANNNTTNNLNDERRHQVTTNHHTSLIRNMHTDDGSIKSNHHQHISGSSAMPTTCNSIASKHPSVSTTIYRMAECNNGSDGIFSKKRRWSAPVICDDEMCRKSGQKNCNHNNHVHGKVEMNWIYRERSWKRARKRERT